MARVGFYNIKTYECLNRELTARHHSYKTIPDYDNPTIAEKNCNKKRDKKAEKKAESKEMLIL